MTPEELVTEGAEIRDRMAADKKRLDEINVILIRQGAGVYSDEAGAKATVIQPKDGIKPEAADIEAARELIGDDDLFRKLFDRVVTWKAVKDLAAIAGAILTPAKCRKVLSLITKTGGAYVRWS